MRSARLLAYANFFRLLLGLLKKLFGPVLPACLHFFYGSYGETKMDSVSLIKTSLRWSICSSISGLSFGGARRV